MSSVGADVNTLPNHKDPYNEPWSLERASTIPFDLRVKMKRARFVHSLTGQHRGPGRPPKAVSDAKAEERAQKLTAFEE